MVSALKPNSKTIPERNSDEWKTFVADAIAKPPAKRTQQEREEIAYAMREGAQQAKRGVGA